MHLGFLRHMGSLPNLTHEHILTPKRILCAVHGYAAESVMSALFEQESYEVKTATTGRGAMQ